VAAHRQNWIPVIAMAGLISFFSTERFSAVDATDIIIHWLNWFFPGISHRRLHAIYFAIRKFAHWAEYFILCVLLLRALRGDANRKWQTRHTAWALLIIFFYAVGDEFHQAFVPNRMASLRDVMIDFFGGICGSFWMYLRHKGKSGA